MDRRCVRIQLLEEPDTESFMVVVVVVVAAEAKAAAVVAVVEVRVAAAVEGKPPYVVLIRC